MPQYNEIGSEFWTESTALDGNGIANVMPNDFSITFTMSGRTAQELIVRHMVQNRSIRSCYLPSYCCHTMIEPFSSHGIAVKFYDVFFTSEGIEDSFDDGNDCDAVLLMDYFGFLQGKAQQRAQIQQERGKTVIYDATHSFFCTGNAYAYFDYVFSSFRKWFGVNAGFVAVQGACPIADRLNENRTFTHLRNQSFDMKRDYMNGENIEKSTFLADFGMAEAILDTQYIDCAPDECSIRALCTLNTEMLIEARRENAERIISGINALSDKRIYSPVEKVRDGECPLFVPLYVDAELRAQFRKYLISERIYLPQHWPLSPLHTISENAKKIYGNELSCVCDQRYHKEEAEIIISRIGSYLKNV